MNEYILAFEAKEYAEWFSWMYVIAIVVGLIAIGFIRAILQAVKKDGLGIFRKEKLLIIPLLFAIVFSYATITIAYEGINGVIDGHSLYNRYQNGDCDYVEGYVTDFHPMPDSLHDSEHFKVNGILFSYGADNSEYYYSTCQKDGGILKEGSYVRLWYTNVDIGGEYPMSYIMRIEIKRSSLSSTQN